MRISRFLSLVLGTFAITCATLAWPQTPTITFTDFAIPDWNIGGALTGINNAGAIIGYYASTTNGPTNSFIWNGAVLKTFQAPNASVTKAIGINGAGWIVGYASIGSKNSGFLLNTKYTKLEVPGSTAVFPASINDADQISGTYLDLNAVKHGFIRDASGNYTSFDVPGGTILNTLLNQSGVIAGSYTDTSSVAHGYVRDASGNVTTFDAQPGEYTYVNGINASSEIAGTSSFGGATAFVRDASGNITLIDLPNQSVSVIGIADNGTVYGGRPVNGVNRIWEYSAAGALTYLVHPNAGYIGTIPEYVSGNGKVAGVYWNEQFTLVGFELRQ